MINPNDFFNKAGRQLQRNNTIVWQKIFAVVQFCASPIFCILRELISVIGKIDWLFSRCGTYSTSRDFLAVWILVFAESLASL